MYKRLIILSIIIIAALCGLSWLGYRAIEVWAQGTEGMRIAEFAEVAEQIRADVKRKLDEFMEREQNRPYYEYQYSYIPDEITTGQQQITIERSPLADSLENDLAYGNFQINSDKSITTPNAFIDDSRMALGNSLNQPEPNLLELVWANSANIKSNLLPVLDKIEFEVSSKTDQDSTNELKQNTREEIESQKEKSSQLTQFEEELQTGGKTQSSRALTKQTQNLAIDSLQNIDNKAQIDLKSRDFIAFNEAQNQISSESRDSIVQSQRLNQQQVAMSFDEDPISDYYQDNNRAISESSRSGFGGRGAQQRLQESQSTIISDSQQDTRLKEMAQSVQQQQAEGQSPADLVEIRYESFVPVIVPEAVHDGQEFEQSIFSGQVYMLRQVQFENNKIIQGFQLNEKKLLEEVEESTRRFMREGMNYELSRIQNENSTYTAILDFVGLGHIILNLIETDPNRLTTQINHLRNLYFGIIAVVFIAVTLAMTSLWLNTRAQLVLAQKKDDFVSAVSHELRTPLTSIRMHAEMLEKNWVKSQDKLGEYYSNIRQESERLSRLIENVLDFSRIQRGKKKYVFKTGDINKCVADVVEMMKPYAYKKGFEIISELSDSGQMTFDSDSVTQIVVNLLDNAIKYARNADDKTIIVRTKSNSEFIIIEVEDHGPGIPHRKRKKIFQEFYRIGAEATRETAGSGLGLALVKKFVEAHNGFVEIIGARPRGVIFRVTLATRM